MNINRHNYEEYFLLYIDDELTVEQKKQVDLFVKENPDLEEELVALQQSRLTPDNTIVFEEKHLLLKEENNSFINQNNYEEWLVLYVDNELSREEKIAVEKFAAAHAPAQMALTLFQQTKLQPEKEPGFPNKELLYKKETKVRIISLAWWRTAAAAILIIAAGITIYSVFTKKINSGAVTTKDELAGTKKEQAPVSAKSTSINQQQQEQNNPVTLEERKAQEKVAVTTPVNDRPNKEKERLKKDNKQPDNNLPSSFKQDILAKTRTPRERSAIVSEMNAGGIKEPQLSDAVVLSDNTHKQFFNDPTVTNLSLQTPDERNTPDNGVEIASNTENKRLRGFFRKATRFIERTTNINPANDDNRVLIGGMAINLK